jgi:hypothetical protein
MEDTSTINQQLYLISHELDCDKFYSMIKNFKLNWSTKYPEFIKFLETKYLNRSDQWEYCMRKCIGINVNTFLENFFFQFKEIYFDGKKVRRFDDMFEGAIDFFHQKHADFNLRLIKKRSTPFLIDTFKNYQQSIKDYNNYKFDHQNEELIISTINSSIKFIIKKLILKDNHICELKCRYCDECIHSYSCTCKDREIRSVFCIHIHLAINFFKQNNQIYDDFNDIEDLSILQSQTTNHQNSNKNLHQTCVDKLKLMLSPAKNKSEIKESNFKNQTS